MTENLLNFNGSYMGRKQPCESFLKNGCFFLVFLGSMRFYQFEFYLHLIFTAIVFLAVVTTTGNFRGKYQNLYLSNRTDYVKQTSQLAKLSYKDVIIP